MRKASAILLTALAIGGPLLAIGALAGADPLATVNGQPIEQQTLYEYMLKRSGSRSLYNIIVALVIQQAAEKQGIKVTDAEVDAAVAKNRENFDKLSVETGADFDMVLFSQGDTLTTFRESELTLLQLKRLVAKDVNITDDAVQEYYRTHLADFKLPEGMKVSYIRMRDEAKLKELRQAIVAGTTTLEEAAKEYSDDPATKDAGGKLDSWLLRGGQEATPFQQAAYALQRDTDLSDVVIFPPLGYYLIRRDQYVRDYQRDFDEVKGEIREALETQTTQRLAAAKQRDLLKAAAIKFLLTWPEGSFLPPKIDEVAKPGGG
jgi:foldase protein PrsA